MLTFQYLDGTERKLHLIICHTIGRGGWKNADRYVRFGMDYLNHTMEENVGYGICDELEYSIVQIGTGRVGLRDGADSAAILTAVAQSFLPVNLFVYDPRFDLAKAETPTPQKAMAACAAWNQNRGFLDLA